MAEYRSTKRKLRSAMNKNKARCWQELVGEVNEDPWRLGYKPVTRKIMALQKPCSLKAEQMDSVVRTLFPALPVRNDGFGAESAKDWSLFFIKDLEQAVLSMESKKAPGRDGIPAEEYKLVLQYRPDHRLLERGHFAFSLEVGKACADQQRERRP